MTGFTPKPRTVEVAQLAIRANTPDPQAHLTGLLSGPVVAILGSRASTAYGNSVAFDLGADLARQGIVLLSGGSYGIETASIRGALSENGRVVTVVPCGVDVDYLADNADLSRRSLELGGAKISVEDEGAVPSRTRFLVRTHLISDLAGAVVIVESALRGSAMAAARQREQHQQLTFAVPGPITSAASGGTNQLLKSHQVRCLTSVTDIVGEGSYTIYNLNGAVPTVA